MTEPKTGEQTGVGVDAGGWPVKDPSENVIDILNLAVRRQDDLREMDSKYQREISDRDLRHIKELADLRAKCNAELRVAETDRIDAIRAVDVGAVTRAAEVSQTQAQTLANQGLAAAEAMRNQVEAARQQTASALAAALDPIQTKLAELSRVQYEQAGGKAQTAESKTDQRSDSSRTWLILGFAGATLFALLGFLIGAAGLYVSLSRGTP